MTEHKEIISIVFIILVIITIIGFIINLVIQFQNDSLLINNSVSKDITNEKNLSFVKYDNKFITGAEVASLIYKYNKVDSIGIIVNNGKKTTCYIKGIKINLNEAVFDNTILVESVGKISSEDIDNNYIKPSDYYYSELCKNKSSEIIGIKFTKSNRQF